MFHNARESIMLNNARVCVCGRVCVCIVLCVWQVKVATLHSRCRGPTLPNQFLMDVRKFMVKNIFDYAQWTRELVNCAKATEHRSDQHPCPLVWLAPATQYPFHFPLSPLTPYPLQPLLNCAKPTLAPPPSWGRYTKCTIYLYAHEQQQQQHEWNTIHLYCCVLFLFVAYLWR